MIFFDSYSISCIECWIWINIYLGKRRTLGCSFGCYSERWGIVAFSSWPLAVGGMFEMGICTVNGIRYARYLHEVYGLLWVRTTCVLILRGVFSVGYASVFCVWYKLKLPSVWFQHHLDDTCSRWPDFSLSEVKAKKNDWYTSSLDTVL